MDLQVGSKIGDYEIIDILGAGGMGKVYKVRNTISDRVEAMKLLLPDLANAPELAERFLREIKVQASLEHPNIASLHTALRVENQLLMLMEFVEGETVEQKLKLGPIPVPQAVDYVRQVLSALEYAHARGVIHRDIKPANMMVMPSGVVKLLDFGIAKATADNKLTQTGMTMGSIYYMSPEQIQGATNLDARADLYSLGVTLYQIVTGKRPFDGDSQYAIMAAHLEKTPVAPIELDSKLPQALNDAIMMAVARDANARFQTATAFRNALGTIAGATRPAAAAVTPMATAAAAAPLAAPPQQDFHVIEPTQPQAPGSHRGLWMAIGGLAAVAAVVAAIQFGPWKGSKAAPVQQPATSLPAQEAAPPLAAAPPSAPPATEPPAVSQSSAPPPVAAQPAATPPPHPEPVARPVRQKPSAPASPLPSAAPPQQTQAAPPAAPERAATPSAPSAPQTPSGPSRAELRERLTLLGARTRGINSSLQSLQRAQAAQGLNLSSRFQQPADLMNAFMGDANSALNGGDLAGAKDAMDKAERQIEILEKLLNR